LRLQRLVLCFSPNANKLREQPNSLDVPPTLLALADEVIE
jgi:hypothetical protein